jgi:HAD superfamily hydrolase (TIGR01509 family)
VEEDDDEGMKRIVVGSSREAKGEYIKVIRDGGLTTLPRYSAVIFDMDGLVLDTESTYYIAWQRAAASLGVGLTDEFCSALSGLHVKAMEEKLIEHCGDTFESEQFFRLSGAYWRDHVSQHGIAEKKGFSKLINTLKMRGIPFCLATNSGKESALECLSLANLAGVFTLIVTRDDVADGKPAPDIFLAAAQKLGQPVNQCLVLEDSATGIQGAVAASAPCVFIPSALPVEKGVVNKADCFLMDLNELAQII